MENFLDYLKIDFAGAVATLSPIIVALLVSFALGMLIHYVYQRSFRGVVYNQAFSVSLAVLTILTTMITLAISSNIALSLGMVGALSIVRYRTAIKDPADLIFLFWAVGTGITIGAKLHYLALVGALIVILMLITIGRSTHNAEIFILIVHYTGEDIADELRRILHGKRYQIKSKTTRKYNVEMAVEVEVKNNNIAFLETINKLPDVSDAALIQYTGEYRS
jgi:ABC-type spermidine/putrescine transport system permease subunit II